MAKLENFRIMNKIGEGTYGKVYKAINKKTKNLVAVKKIKLDDYENYGVPVSTLREISLLKELKHPNIVKLIDIICEIRNITLIFEYVSMDLSKYLKKLPKEQYLSDKEIQSYLYQILTGILYCHKRRIIHRDLKTENILIDVDNGIIKIADFGLGRAMGEYKSPSIALTNEVATLWYRSPEILLGFTNYHYPMDIWSIGCIFAEIIRKIPLFTGLSEIEQLIHIFGILTTPNDDIWPGVSKYITFKQAFPKYTQDKLQDCVLNLNEKGINLLRSMLCYDPKNRISAKDACKHDYFNDLDFANLPILPIDD